MFGDVVLGIDHEEFEHELATIKKNAGAKFDIELTAAHLKELVTKYKEVYKRNSKVLPDDPWEQLRMGIDAVFRYGSAVGAICCCCQVLCCPGCSAALPEDTLDQLQNGH
eukprot:GHUV01055015.1.p1 GENE.GHUV01055015.1~~GHUV01055015.1.p1  ORF type:complete len:110 (-),score=44.40 GHUV01055015.1:146-475(-)